MFKGRSVRVVHPISKEIRKLFVAGFDAQKGATLVNENGDIDFCMTPDDDDYLIRMDELQRCIEENDIFDDLGERLFPLLNISQEQLDAFRVLFILKGETGSTHEELEERCPFNKPTREVSR